MVIKALCRSFRQFGLTANRAALARYCSTQTSNVVRNRATIFYKPEVVAERSIYEPNFLSTSVRPAILDLNLPRHPASIGRIHEFPIDDNAIVGEPPKIERRSEDSLNDKSLELPTCGNTVEKKAVTMIVIRRRKMRKHKRRKLRKKMQFVWAKIRQRREMKKEKAFHAELLGQIRAAEKFDAKAYVESRLALLDEVRWPTKYRGVELPESQIREFIERDRLKRERKLNPLRLTL